jgi:hypothetical protein
MVIGLLLAALVQIQVPVHDANWHAKNSQRDTIVEDGTLYPERGSYDSADVEVIKAQNAQMAETGVLPAISHWGPEGSPKAYVGDLFLDKYLSIPSPVKCTILYEATERLKLDPRTQMYSFDDPENVAAFRNDMEHYYARYFSQSKYRDRFLTINGKPVVFIWISHAFRGDFQKASWSLPHRENIYLIGSNFNLAGGTPAEGDVSIIGGLDAVSAYNTYDPALAKEVGRPDTDGRYHMNAAYVDRYLWSVSRWSLWLSRNTPHISLILPISFSYEDRKFKADGTWENPAVTSTYEEAKYFAEQVRTAIINSVRLCRNILPYVIVVSWNEYYEGSSIEPTIPYGRVTKSYGHDLIDVIRQTFREPVSVDSTCTP